MKVEKTVVRFSDSDIIMALTKETDQYNNVIVYVYEQNFDRVMAMIMNKGGNDFDAEDVFQEALVLFIHSVRKGSFKGTAKVSTYIYSICHNLWINSLNKRKKYQLDDNPYEFASADVDLVEVQEIPHDALYISQKFQVAFKSLQTICQDILKKFYHQEESLNFIFNQHRDIFSSEQALRNRKSKCLQALRDAVAEHNISREMMNDANFERLFSPKSE